MNLKIKATSKIFLNDFVHLLYPKVCAACGKNLYKNELCICTQCRYRLPKTEYHLLEDNPVSRLFWGKVNVESAAAYYYFNKGTKVQRLIHMLKYKSRTDVGLTAGELFGKELKESPLFRNIDLVVPVPLHPQKLAIRGYNQSDLVAEGISKGMLVPFIRDTLQRVKHTATQTRKSRFKRWENVKSMFTLNPLLDISGKHVLLVDDVVTTGSTLEACAMELLKIPHAKVSIAALAYAVKL